MANGLWLIGGCYILNKGVGIGISRQGLESWMTVPWKMKIFHLGRVHLKEKCTLSSNRKGRVDGIATR